MDFFSVGGGRGAYVYNIYGKVLLLLRNELFPDETNVGSDLCVGSDNISDKYSKLLHFSHFCLLSQQSYQKLMNLTAIFGLLRLLCQK